MARVLRVLVVESQTSERRRLVDSLAGEPGVDVVGETENPEHAVALAASILPDVVLLPANLEHTSYGAYSELVAKLRTAAPKAHVLVLTRAEEGNALANALHAGASGYLVRNLDGGFMADTLRSTVEHGGPFGFRATAIDGAGNTAVARLPAVSRTKPTSIGRRRPLRSPHHDSASAASAAPRMVANRSKTRASLRPRSS